MQQECILVTGATGNVGEELVKSLVGRSIPVRAGVRNPAKEAPAAGFEWTALDFEKPETFTEALRGVRKVFLLRPPAISDVKKYLFPFVDAAKHAGVEQMVFMSLAGIEQRKFVPHYKVEQYIRQSGIPFTFLRPAFFMQNLSTVHAADIRQTNTISLPAGKGKTAFIDARDIAEAARVAMTEAGHLNAAYELTGTEALDYYEVARQMSQVLGRSITYTNPSAFRFFFDELRKGRQVSFVLVMIMLYALTKYGKADHLTTDLETLLGRKPISFAQFVADNRAVWQ